MPTPPAESDRNEPVSGPAEAAPFESVPTEAVATLVETKRSERVNRLRRRGTVAVVEPARVTLLDIDPTPEAFVVRVAAEQEVISKLGEGPLESAVLAFEQALSRLPRSQRNVAVILEDPLIVDRVLHLPKVRERQLRILVNQAARRENATVSSFRVLGTSVQEGREGLAVHAAFARGEILNSIDRAAQRQGGWVRTVTSHPVGGVVVAEHFGTATDLKGRFLMIEVRREKLRLSLVTGGDVSHSRHVDMGGAVRAEDVAGRCITEVQRTNIFLNSRYRESPADQFLLVCEDAGVGDAIAERLETQFQLPLGRVRPSIRIEGSNSPQAGDSAYDAVALLSSRSNASTATLQVETPARLNRKRAFQMLPVMVLLGALSLVGVWWVDRNARVELRNLEQLLKLERSAVEQIPTPLANPGAVNAARASLVKKTEDLAVTLNRPRPLRATLEEILQRMPRDVLVRQARIRRAPPRLPVAPAAPSSVVAPVTAPSAAPIPMGDELVIEGLGLFDHNQAPRLMEATIASLRKSPMIQSLTDQSGEYDPFKKTTKLTEKLYPVRLLVRLTEAP